MIKKMAWNTFKNTGSIETYMELIKIENIEKNKNLDETIKVENYGGIEDKGNSNCRKEF